MKKLWLLLLLAGCHKAHLQDKKVARREMGTDMICMPIIGGKGGCVLQEETVFYLISTDNMSCEVPSRDYRKVEIGKMFLCEWEEE